jgi:hypothetical protein
VFATEDKKWLPNNSEAPIETMHANSGFTYSCSSKPNEIVIFRREEWFKVFIHETFHSMGLDFSSDNQATEYSNEYILSLFPILDPNTDVRLYETFCEMWAELFYLAFRLFLRGKKPLKFSVEKYQNGILKEQLFSIYQSNKILKKQGISMESMYKPHVANVYKENTPAFSYYVLKSALLWNVDEFIKWCVETNLKHVLQFKHGDIPTIKKYCLLVENSIKSKKYIGAVKHLKKDKDLCGEHIRKTLRMTSH